MLRLDLRSCKLNQDHKGKGQEKDGVVTRLLTFGLIDVPIYEDELPVITGEPHAYRALYNIRKDGVAEPFLKCFGPQRFEEKIKGAYVKVRLKGGEEFEFTDCTLSPPEFQLTEGGTTLMSCSVECAPALDARFPQFIAELGQTADVEIRGELPTDQQDLPLSRHGEGEAPEQGEKKPRGRGRRNGEARAH